MRRAPEVNLPPAGSKTFAHPRLQDPSLLVQKSVSRYRLRKRLRIFTGNHIPPFPVREPLGLFPRPATLLRSATFSASSCEDPPHIANRFRLALQDQRAGSSPSGARSVGESTHVAFEDQVLFDARAKKILENFCVGSPKRNQSFGPFRSFERSSSFEPFNSSFGSFECCMLRVVHECS